MSSRAQLGLDTPLTEVRGIGAAYLKRIGKLGIHTAGDFLLYFPARYEDFSHSTTIAELTLGEEATIHAQVIKVTNKPLYRRRMTITEAILEDETGSVAAVWFNQPYLKDTLEDRRVSISGKLSLSGDHLVFSNPLYEVIGSDEPSEWGGVHTGRLVPVYPETRGVSSRWLRYKIKTLSGLVKQFKEFLPADILKRYKLPGIQTAILNMHFPRSERSAEAARKRFAFADMFVLQLFILQQKALLSREKAVSIPFDEQLVKRFIAALPFTLTLSQKKAMWEIFQDLERSRPMNRLLEGDVGSGKTVVAASAVIAVAARGYQSAFMAPTEILALQHFENLQKLMRPFNVSLGVMTSGKSVVFDPELGAYEVKKERLIELIAAGDIQLLVGTHSLIQDFISFPHLALVVIDEQHRFGVGQRTRLLYKGRDGAAPHSADPVEDADRKALAAWEKKAGYLPHLLSMTATPIPRTMALGIYGDLDMSLLRHMPKGRKKIQTSIVSPAGRARTYAFVKQELNAGRQAFVICPLVEDSEKLQAKAAVEEFAALEKIFLGFRVGLIHGKMKSAEKEKIMLSFNERHIDILVATSVIEVGIDVPNATCMIIEGAERFGLAQLHQLRGRIGRGEHQSHCFLFTDSAAKKTRLRLEALMTARDGYELAEQDLKIRGPGEFLGVKQSGIPDLAMKSLNNEKLIIAARTAAEEILQEDPDLLRHPELAQRVNQFSRTVHLE